ncbi:MAG: hypothetical protein HZC41_17610 [Chloroflexi bacterium]|nr:hypothetical protein [Chloroflexota bacterium]
MERWLHQHIFKVGWLITRQLQTTTILFYAFFLPGIVIHEFVYWAMAGLLNVRADRVLEWPKQQEVAELRLNFVKLAPRTGPIKLALITAAPFAVGVLLVWLIANNVLNVSVFAQSMQSGVLGDVSGAVSRFISTPDFWLWIYLVFTISNTLTPAHPEHLRGWWIILGAMGVAFVVLMFLGTAGEVLVNALHSLNDSVNALSGTLGVIIGIDLFMVAVLGTIEAIIERITGNSATFKDGKLVTMTRAELLEQRAAELRRSRALERQKPARTAPAGPPSIYRLPLPIPGAPGKETVSRAEDRIIAPESKPLPSPLSPTAGRAAPDVIAGTIDKPSPAIPPRVAGIKPPATDDEDEAEMDDDDGDELTYEDLDESV